VNRLIKSKQKVTKGQDNYIFPLIPGHTGAGHMRMLVPYLLLALLLSIPSVFGATSSVGNNNTGTVAQSAADGGGGSSEVYIDGSGGSYTAPSFSAAQGTDTVQIGSLIFGSVTVSRDARTSELRRNMSTVAAMRDTKLVSEDVAKKYAEWTVEELKKETKPRKCFAVIPCGRERSLRNLFGLLW